MSFPITRFAPTAGPQGKDGSLTWIVKTANYTAVAGEGILADTDSVGAFTVTLPASPANGDRVGIIDAKSNFAVANLTVARNGSLIEGATNNKTLSVAKTNIIFTYSGATVGWVIDVGTTNMPLAVGSAVGAGGSASTAAPIDHRHAFDINGQADGEGMGTGDKFIIYRGGIPAPGNYSLTLEQLLSIIMPSGSFIMWGGATAPAGFLLCDGSAVSRETYANLYSEIATVYGAGDGSTTFNVPDFRGRSPMGVGTGTGGGASGTGLPSGGSALTAVSRGSWWGAETHTLTTAQMPTHKHNAYFAVSGSGVSCINGSVGGNTNPSGTTIANAGSSTAHNNLAPRMGVNFIIKT